MMYFMHFNLFGTEEFMIIYNYSYIYNYCKNNYIYITIINIIQLIINQSITYSLSLLL